MRSKDVTQPAITPPDLAPAIPWLRSFARLTSTTARQLGGAIKEGVGVLMHHRISTPPPGLPRPTLNVSPRKLQAQLAGLLRLGYRPWPLSRLLDRLDRGQTLPRRAFAVTFDDCFANVADEAWPVLRRLEVPATLFLATAYLDSDEPFPFDEWTAAAERSAPSETWRPIRGDQVARMARSPLIELGSHSHTHDDFRDQPQRLVDDVGESLEVLSRRFHVERPAFAFPYGVVAAGLAGGDLSAALRQTPVRCGFSTDGRLLTADADRFAWGRFEVAEEDTALSLAAKLDGWWETFRDGLHALRGWRPGESSSRQQAPSKRRRGAPREEAA